jgi:hypothetical protein
MPRLSLAVLFALIFAGQATAGPVTLTFDLSVTERIDLHTNLSSSVLEAYELSVTFDDVAASTIENTKVGLVTIFGQPEFGDLPLTAFAPPAGATVTNDVRFEERAFKSKPRWHLCIPHAVRVHRSVDSA